MHITLLENHNISVEDGKIGDFIKLGFSLSSDGKEMTIYETFSKDYFSTLKVTIMLFLNNL